MIAVTWREALALGALREAPDEDPYLAGLDHLDPKTARARAYRRMAGDAARSNARVVVATRAPDAPPSIDASLPGRRLT